MSRRDAGCRLRAGCRPCAVELVLDLPGRIWCWLMFLRLVAALPWSGPEAMRSKGIGNSFNKVSVGSSSSAAEPVLRISSARSGGAGRKWQPDVFSSGGGLSWSWGTVLWSTISAAFVCRPTLMAIWWSRCSPVWIPGDPSTSIWRPLVTLVMALDVYSVPSGVVPGIGEDGHGASARIVGGGGGLDCFFHFLFRVLFVISRGLIVISVFLLAPVVTCAHRRW